VDFGPASLVRQRREQMGDFPHEGSVSSPRFTLRVFNWVPKHHSWEWKVPSQFETRAGAFDFRNTT
jgi:hypothetical protein